MPPPTSTPQVSQRAAFHAFCKAHLSTRPSGGYISSQASRLLLKYVKAFMEKLPLLKRNMDSVTRKVLDRFPGRRIDLDLLEKYELVTRRAEYAESSTGDEYKYKSILREAFVDGEPKVRVEWEPTWEPVANIPKRAMKAFRDKNRAELTDARGE